MEWGNILEFHSAQISPLCTSKFPEWLQYPCKATFPKKQNGFRVVLVSISVLKIFLAGPNFLCGCPVTWWLQWTTPMIYSLHPPESPGFGKTFYLVIYGLAYWRKALWSSFPFHLEPHWRPQYHRNRPLPDEASDHFRFHPRSRQSLQCEFLSLFQWPVMNILQLISFFARACS